MFMKRIGLFLAAIFLTSCAQIATVKQTTPRFPATAGTPEPQLALAERGLDAAREEERRDPTAALGKYLVAAQLAAERLRAHPSDKQARDLYDFAVGRSIQVIEDARLAPWHRAITVSSPNGPYTLSTILHPGPDREPADYEIIPADSVIVGGTYFTRRITVAGLGAPLVVMRREPVAAFRKTFASRRMYAAATALIRFHGRRAEIEFLDPFETDDVVLAGHTYPLAADYTAPLAVGLTIERPDKLGLIRLLRPEKYADTARLTRLQPYDPNRTPVIFVHGLQDTPASWTPMINALWGDPEIRRRYQLWVYSYPSGYPYSYSAALFRKELDAIARAYPNRKRIVLIGHSMGGMVSRLMITDAGDKIWRSYVGKSPAQTNIPGKQREIFEEALVFNHRPEVKRVVFMSTPHRGSDFATNWVGRIAASLVRIPFQVASIPITVFSGTETTTDFAALKLKRMPNSIDTLSPKNRFVVAVNKIPITPGIPYHSIIGDRGRGDTPKSSDGVVAYWSSHLDGAQSELIVPSNHSSPRNPQAIAEVRRILLSN